MTSAATFEEDNAKSVGLETEVLDVAEAEHIFERFEQLANRIVNLLQVAASFGALYLIGHCRAAASA
jgi:hypothetical protein